MPPICERAENYEFDDRPEQSEEERTPQFAHRRAIEECDDVRITEASAYQRFAEDCKGPSQISG